MFLLFIVFLAVSTYLSYKRTVYGCACLLVSRILIPECVRLTPFLDVSLNTAVILILVFFAFRDIFTIKNISTQLYTLLYKGFCIITGCHVTCHKLRFY